MEFPKNFNFKEREKYWYSKWEENRVFKSDQNSDKEKYSVLMPPPNVTGILHFGHVLNHTLQDLYIRRNRMDGKEVCWFPGMDHAGIATQTRVERAIKEEENLTRHDLGREKFIEKVWEWKDKYGGIILDQLKRLGVSADWDRTLFTMDESASAAVKHVFITLFDKGLIYKGKRIINWSPLSQTALSDEEVEFKEVNEKIFTLRYKLESGEYLKVATVRPETIFGDVAVAVNEDDERYKHLIGTEVSVPLVNRKIPIIADEHADPEFGTGCVKITPAHDPNDFMVGERHNLEMINTINTDGSLNELTGKYNGLDRFEARKVIVEDLKSADLIEDIEDYSHNVGFSQRGGEPIEPYLSDQWFVKMEPLAKDALNIVDEGKINFYPNHWVKTYEHWLSNIKDWCISRQLWWGHRIPVYYTQDGRFTAAKNEEEARKKLNIDSSASLKQDPDVLDTWFSSWIWPMTTMNWFDDEGNEQANNKVMSEFLPTDLLVTGPDIIFFWVARMIMATKEYKKEIPFKDVYFTSMIRDGQGRKLSKSLGNSPDPLNIFDKYGADAVRFTMIYLSPLGQDVRMDVDVDSQDIPSMEIGRNFVNKLWNAGRFLTMKKEEFENTPNSEFTKSLSDKWIEGQLNNAIKNVEDFLKNYKVTEYSKTLYDFVWSDFCDWYIEALKVETWGDDKKGQKDKVNFAIHIYNQILKMLHPVMPFVTEDLWHIINTKDDNETISKADNPNLENISFDSESHSEFESLKDLIEKIRTLRSNVPGISPGQKLPVSISLNDENQESKLINNIELIEKIGKCSEFNVNHKFESNAVKGVTNLGEIQIDVGEAIDIEGEKKRINEEINRLEGQVKGIGKKLENEKFVNNAPKDVVEREKKKFSDMNKKIQNLKQSLSSFE